MSRGGGRVACYGLAALVLFLAPANITPAADTTGVQTFPVDRGTTGVLLEDHRVPLVEVIVEFPAGSWSPWVRDHHADEAFEVLLHDSTGRLRARADALAADLDLMVGPYTATVRASCLREDLDAVLGLIHDLLTGGDIDRHELKRRHKERSLAWSAARKRPEFLLQQAGARLLFAPDDPRRRPWERPEKPETRVPSLLAARDSLVRIPGRVIAFAGDLGRRDAERSARNLLPPPLEAAPGPLEPRLGPVVPAGRRPAEQTVRTPRITQVFFAYGRESLTFTDEDFPAFLVADHVLGGHFFSRLSVALRHEGGETYGAGTVGGGGLVPRPYALATFTRTGNAPVVEAKLRQTLGIFHEQGITEEERQAAVGYLLGRRPFSRQAPAQVIARYLWERRHDLPAGFRDGLVDRAARVPLEEINAFIRRFYDPTRFSLLQVAPR